MNFSFKILITIIVVVILFSVAFGSMNVEPYTKATHESPAKYEGLATMTPSELAPTAAPTEEKEDKKSIASLFSKKDDKKEDKEGMADMTEAYNTTSIDYFSTLKSGNDCGVSPYSNSKGYVCLDEKAKSLLSTRGGNSTGADAIGASGSPAAK